MKFLRPASSQTIAILGLLLLLASGHPGLAQAPAAAPPPPPALPPPLISLAEARVIIDGAVAFARSQNLNAAAVVVDTAGNIVSADKMDGTTINNVRFAEGKAFASAIMRQTTEVLGELAKTRPDRYFGIMNVSRQDVSRRRRRAACRRRASRRRGRRCWLTPRRRRESGPSRNRGLGQIPRDHEEVILLLLPQRCTGCIAPNSRGKRLLWVNLRRTHARHITFGLPR
jgi:hypothetical protein